jgi:hypothetical protein
LHDEAVPHQRLNRLTDRDARDIAEVGDIAFGRQRSARRQGAIADLLFQPLPELEI